MKSSLMLVLAMFAIGVGVAAISATNGSTGAAFSIAIDAVALLWIGLDRIACALEKNKGGEQ